MEHRASLKGAGKEVAAFDEPGFARAHQQMAQILDALQDADEAPSKALAAALEERNQTLTSLTSAWPKTRRAAQALIR